MTNVTKARKPRAEALFRKLTEPAPALSGNEVETTCPGEENPASQSRPVETTEGAMDEYLARQQAERAKMAQLRKLRLAAEAKAAIASKTKRKPGGK